MVPLTLPVGKPGTLGGERVLGGRKRGQRTQESLAAQESAEPIATRTIAKAVPQVGIRAPKKS